MKFCRDCIHYDTWAPAVKTPVHYSRHLCLRLNKLDLVTGQYENQEQFSAGISAVNDLKKLDPFKERVGDCGEAAIHFLAKATYPE